MDFNTLQGWLDWIESCHPSEIELGLDRIKCVASRLPLDFSNTQLITVAGTNGKGSCVAVLEYLLLNSGYTVGSYTSPHFLHYNERFKLDGVQASDEQIVAAFRLIETVRGDTTLTYFEYATLAALVMFSSLSLDIVVLEVGLGGRLDATNIVDADISIVTNIAIDHEDWLGSDPFVIGQEKAGIYRHNKIALCGDPAPPLSVKEVASKVGAHFYQRGEHFDVRIINDSMIWQGLDSTLHSYELSSLPLPLLPLDSVVVAIQACQFLDVNIAPEIYQHINEISLTGRFQHMLIESKSVIFDVAHNPAAAQLLAERLKNDSIEGRTFALFAVMADKDKEGIIEPLLDVIDVWVLADLEHVPRAQQAEALAVYLKERTHSEVQEGTTIDSAFNSTLSMMTDKDRLLVFGSFFTVAAVLAAANDANPTASILGKV